MRNPRPRATAVLSATALVSIAALTGCKPQELPPAPPPVAALRTEVDYALVRTMDPGVGRLEGLALGAQGRLYLAGERGVRVLDGEGEELLVIETDALARAVAVDEQGAIYVALKAEVRRYGADGVLHRSWGVEGKEPGQFSVLTGVAVSGPDVYVADAGNRCVHRFDLTGDLVNDLGRRDPEAGVLGIICPSPHLDAAIGPDGMLHVNNPGRLRIERYWPDGELVDWWGEPGMSEERFCGCCNPTDIALTPDGRTVTAEKGIVRVKLYDAAGKLLAFIGPEHFSPEADGMDVAVDAEGRIYVADNGANKVLVFEVAAPAHEEAAR